MDFKELQMGILIKERVNECKVSSTHLCSFFGCTEKELEATYNKKSLDCDELLRWSRLLEYDFFRLYSQHIILYSPQTKNYRINNTSLPVFKKSIYTREIIEFVLDIVEKQEKTKKQIIEEYNIPKTTLYKWIQKYNTKKERIPNVKL